MVRHFASSFSVMIAGTGAGFLLHLLLAKLLSADGYGVYNFILSVTMIVSLLALFGLPSGVVRFIAGYLENKKDHSKIRGLVGFSSVFTTALGILLGALVYGALYIFDLAVQYPAESLLAGFALVPLTVMQRLNAGIIRGFHKTTLSVAYETLFRELGILILLGLALAAGFTIDKGMEALMLMIIVMIAIIAASFIHIRKAMPEGPASREKSEWKEWLTVSAPMMLTVAFQRIMKRVDLIFIGLMMGPASAGIYALMVHFADGATIASKSALAVFSPKAAAAYKRGDKPELRRVYLWALAFVCGSSVFMAVAEFFIVPYVLPYIGENYMNGFNSLLILLGWYIIATLFGPASNLMIMSQYERAAMWITVISALLNVGLNPVFIYFYGIEGAAFVTGFVVALRNILSAAYVYRKGVLSDTVSS